VIEHRPLERMRQVHSAVAFGRKPGQGRAQARLRHTQRLRPALHAEGLEPRAMEHRGEREGQRIAEHRQFHRRAHEGGATGAAAARDSRLSRTIMSKAKSRSATLVTWLSLMRTTPSSTTMASAS
jgi:hypothetical protein